jgi:hypothetical protein
MHRLRRWLLLTALGVGAGAGSLGALLIATPSTALARTSAKVQWTSIRVPPGKDADRLARTLKSLLSQAAKKADFGAAKNVRLTARVVSFTSEKKGDVLQVSCTIVGRLVGGPTARSRISFGGSPSEREQLEKQVLTMVANGLVARLAEIARVRAAAEEKTPDEEN